MWHLAVTLGMSAHAAKCHAATCMCLPVNANSTDMLPMGAVKSSFSLLPWWTHTYLIGHERAAVGQASRPGWGGEIEVPYGSGWKTDGESLEKSNLLSSGILKNVSLLGC